MATPTARYRLLPFRGPDNATQPQKSFNGSDVYFPWWTGITLEIEGTTVGYNSTDPKTTLTYASPAPISPKWVNDLQCVIVVAEDKIAPYYCLYDTKGTTQHPDASPLGAVRFYYFDRVLKRMAGACEILLKLDVWQSFTGRLIPMAENGTAWPYYIMRGGMPYLGDMGVNRYHQDPLFNMQNILPRLIYSPLKTTISAYVGDNPYGIANTPKYVADVTGLNKPTMTLDLETFKPNSTPDYMNCIYYIFQGPNNPNMHVNGTTWQELTTSTTNHVMAFPCFRFEQPTINVRSDAILGIKGGWILNGDNLNTDFLNDLLADKYSYVVMIKNSPGTTAQPFGSLDPKIAVGQNALEQLKQAFPTQFKGVFTALNLTLFNNHLSWLGYWGRGTIGETDRTGGTFNRVTNDQQNTTVFGIQSSSWYNWIAHSFNYQSYKTLSAKTVGFHLISNQPQPLNNVVQPFMFECGGGFNWYTFANADQIAGVNGTLPYPIDYFGTHKDAKWVDKNGTDWAFLYSDNVMPNQYVLSKTTLYGDDDFTPFELQSQVNPVTASLPKFANQGPQNMLRMTIPDFHWFDNGYKLAGTELGKIYSFPASYPVNTDTYSQFIQANRATIDTSLQIAKNNRDLAIFKSVVGGAFGIAGGLMDGEGGSALKAGANAGLGILSAINSYKNTEMQIQAKIATAQNINQSQLISGSDSDTLFNLMQINYTTMTQGEIYGGKGNNTSLYNGVLVRIATDKGAELFNYLSRQYGAYINNTTTNWCFIKGYNDALGGVDGLAGQGDLPEQIFAQAFNGESAEIQQAFKNFVGNPLRIWRAKPNNPTPTN